MKNVLIAQSGGPTAAINATLAGIFERAVISADVGCVYGALHGIKGVINDNIINLDEKLSNANAINQLINTPSSALGSCRMKLGSPRENPETYETIFNNLRKHNIGWFIYIGGNDSMDTVLKLADYGKSTGSEISIMGAPKTIDNDLCGMDHTPGFGSAAKCICTTFIELWHDIKVYDVPAVTIVEVMGRHAGWLTASSALAHQRCGAPQLIYLPEVAFDSQSFIADVQENLLHSPALLIAVSEGIKYADGSFVGESAQSGMTDQFGHKYLSGTSRVLESLVREKVGCKVRAIDLSLMQRSAGHLASQSDLTEARLLGATALDRAIKGISGEVSVIHRTSDSPYSVRYSTVHVNEIANQEKTVPPLWINEQGNFVTEEMIKYLTPLIEGETAVQTHNGLPLYIDLNK
ncbi:MAG: 6-phosphofructokinase [Defluviitaleaceae bacterium]|nr:6-phosphofructokinase [Defluviitaleaceae bacterium]